MALEKQLKYKVGEQRLLPFAEEMIKEDRREMWITTIPDYLIKISVIAPVVMVFYDFCLKDPINNFIEYVMQY